MTTTPTTTNHAAEECLDLLARHYAQLLRIGTLIERNALEPNARKRLNDLLIGVKDSNRDLAAAIACTTPVWERAK
jgi:hypothetical protein